ncbi:mitogen-activated protein kinase phosphatase 1 [Plasmopara halstedii]|uniref:Mitogen-activated protein kinase phosphatase 1 n=1 Tax=Plasmopara halstedii TaxID=4781 RepID=A0A0P1AJN6_PLAHL|nr:mitogen-activated protein kinase phosphatase 1 [Plasmopara halstedii]CEG40842.1 mitogen-activated protein kinase phosphatase 1 [Plasmopara halstedii]|eukprot:XP_024577211.1 mitogen-activated protein kinase phosphatase 1 [Plasmopara halstedii]
MELGPVATPHSGRVNSAGDGYSAKRKLESAHSLFSLSASSSPSNSTIVPSNIPNSSRANAAALLPIDSHLKLRRRSSAEPPSLLRCYSDGKILEAFGELLTAEGTADSQRQPLPNVCLTPPARALPNTPQKINSVCPSPGQQRNPFRNDGICPLSTHGVLVTRSNINNTTALQHIENSSLMFIPPTPNKRVCSQQGFKAGTTCSGNWSPLLSHARKGSEEVLNASHSTSGSPSDKRTYFSIDLNLKSRNTAVVGAMSSCSSSLSIPPDTVLSRSGASVPKGMFSPQQRHSRNPGNLSLDLSQVDQTKIDTSTTGTGGLQRRNDQAAVCSKLTDFLYIGGAVAAKSKSMLLQNGITHVINCAASVAPASYPDAFCYFNIRLRDHSSEDIARHFYSLFDFIERARESGGRIFLHCVKGISRSPTMAIAYLMWYKNIGMYKALDLVRQVRPVVDPNAGFIFQLTEWENIHPNGRIKFQKTVVFQIDVAYAYLDSKCFKDSATVPNTPLFLGPLTSINEHYFRDPTQDIGELCLIVASANYMFVWCGTDVNEDQVNVAERGAQILQRYEAFPRKCDTVLQGQEPVAFWDLVGGEI